jgi:hypothetical protein
MDALKLCYVDRWGPFAWFTTAQLDQQWGDDWDDSPDDCNSGQPYEWAEYRKVEPYTLFKVAFEGDFERPSSGSGGHHPERWVSVEDINLRRAAPWLRTSSWTSNPIERLWAGASYAEFCNFIINNGGMVYEPISGTLPPHER